MEMLVPHAINRRWFYCVMASCLGYLLLYCGYNHGWRRAVPLIASFRNVEAGLSAAMPKSPPPSSAPLMSFVQAPQESIALCPWPSTQEEVSPPPNMGLSPSPDGMEMAFPPSNKEKSPSQTDTNESSTVLLPQDSDARIELPHPSEEEAKSSEEKYCDLFVGRWVYDIKAYPLYRAHWCPFLSEQVTCQKNGRPDSDYEHWRWEPKGCEIPRFTGRDLLERLRGKRVVIVGDSLNRNMWESLACLLYSSVHWKRTYVKFFGPNYKIFRAIDYNCTVEFYWSPFLVRREEMPDQPKVLNLDQLPEVARRWRGANVMVFNTGHWWTHRGQMRAWDYLERRGQLLRHMEVDVAYNRAIRTWARWVDRYVDPTRTTVFFRSISPEHKSKNWCYNQTHLITNETYVQRFPRSMISIVERTIRKMRTPVRYLNITRLSEYRIDGHTSVYTSRQGKLLSARQRMQPATYADCSHWCLPGLPDTWNISISRIPLKEKKKKWKSLVWKT